MSRLLLFFALFVISNNIIPQSDNKIDSLKRKLIETHDFDVKAEIYLNLANIYAKKNVDTSMLMINNALKYAKEIDSDIFIAKSYVHMGLLNVMRDNLDEAILQYKNSIPYHNKTNDIHSEIDVLIILGNLYYVKGNYPEAMYIYTQALTLSKQSNYLKKLPFCYNNLGTVYFSQKDYKKSLDYFTLGLKLYKEQNDTLNTALAYGNIGSIYFELNSLGIAKHYYLKAEKVYKGQGDMDGIAQSLVQLSEIHLKKNQADSAIIHLNNSLRLYNSMHFGYRGPKSMWVIDIYANLGKSYMILKDWNTAIHNLMNGYLLATKTSQNSLIVESSLLLSSAYDSLNYTDSSYKYFKIYKYYSDSILNEDKIREIAQIDYQSKLDQKMFEKESEDSMIQAKQSKRNLVYFIIFFFLIILIILFVLLLKLEKNKKAKIELEQIQLKKDLEFKNKEITTHVLYLLKKNEFILSISEKLKNIIPAIKVQNKKLIADVINELKSGTSNDTWKEFEIRFQQVHTSFYENLNDSYPTLSPNELRLCAFLRLNMTTKDIAAITYQSLNSIEIARTRLRKKLGLEKTDNLISFLNTL